MHGLSPQLMKLYNIKDLLKFMKKRTARLPKLSSSKFWAVLCSNFYFFPNHILKEQSGGFLQPFPCSKQRQELRVHIISVKGHRDSQGPSQGVEPEHRQLCQQHFTRDTPATQQRLAQATTTGLLLSVFHSFSDIFANINPNMVY